MKLSLGDLCANLIKNVKFRTFYNRGLAKFYKLFSKCGTVPLSPCNKSMFQLCSCSPYIIIRNRAFYLILIAIMRLEVDTPYKASERLIPIEGRKS